MKKLFIILCLAFFYDSAEATKYWASVGGSASPTCTSIDGESDPGSYGTIQGAAGCLSSGDTLFIKNGTYNEAPRDWFPSGTSSARTIIQGESLNAIIRPSAAGSVVSLSAARQYITFSTLTLDAVTSGGSAFVASGSTGIINHITIEDSDLKNTSTNGLSVLNVHGGSTGWIVRRNKIHDNLKQTVGQSLIYARGDNAIFEYNEIYNGTGNGLLFQFNDERADNNIARYNYIHNTGSLDTGGAGGISDNGQDSLVHNNLLVNNSGYGMVATVGWSGRKHYNNTHYGNGTGAIRYKAPSANIVNRNSILVGTILNQGTNNSIANHSTSAACMVNPGGGDFSLTQTSACMDAGTTISGFSSCVGICDQGVYEVPKLNSCSAVNNIISLVFDNPRFPPLSNLAATGITAVIDGTSRTLSAPTLVGSNQVDMTFTGAAVSATATAAGSTSVAITDSANIGNVATNVQKVLNWATTGCTVIGASGQLTQSHFRGHDLLGSEDLPVILRAQNVNFTIQQGGCFRCRVQVHCETGACPVFAPVFRYSMNGGAYTAVPNTFDSDNIRYYGTSDTSPDIPTHLSTVGSELLTNDFPTNVASVFLRSADSIPNITMPINSESEFEGAFCIDRDAPVGTTYALRLYRADGSAMNAYTFTPTATVVAPGMYQMGKLGPWDLELRLGSELRMGSVRRRATDRSRFVYPDVPKSAVVYQVQ